MTQNHSIKITLPDPTLHPLPLGGTNPQGITIAANQRSLTLAGKPWLPVMGEFHFSRYPSERWEEELLKMKAGGINVVASYLFWIHIEEIEGQFDWSGSRDLRRFVELCGKHGLYAYPRIGPWAHGECRNGGFPDWLLEKCGKQVRQDAPLYLSYVRRFFTEIIRQLQGLLWKDGGPVIGIQLENELLDNAGHIRSLKQMACEIGFDVPLYTMTAWGPADVPPGGDILPVFGGYPDAFWDRQVEDWSRPSRKHYFFSNLRDDNTIGADLRQRSGTGDLNFLEQFPYGTCEIGGGMQAAYHRRPRIQPEDISVLASMKIGNGSSLQGYYMYHGGANPPGQRSTMQETQSTGYPQDLPVINYDFQAPLGQYGQVRESYHALRLLHLFLNDFGEQLAPLPLCLPEVMPSSLDDRETLRWSARSDGERGFLFINNYQRIEQLPGHQDVQFTVELPQETLLLPYQPIDIPAGMHAIWPINLDLSGVRLRYATAQPVCRVEVDGAPLYVFFQPDGVESEFAFDPHTVGEVVGPARWLQRQSMILANRMEPGTNCLLTITTQDNHPVQLLLLNQRQARGLWKARIGGQERLFLCSDSLRFDGDTLRLQSDHPGPAQFAVLPAPAGMFTAGDQQITGQADGLFAHYTVDLPARDIPLDVRRIRAADPARRVSLGPAGVAQAPEDADFTGAETWQVTFPPEVLDGACEALLQIAYIGDAARAYLADRLIDDDFYSGRTWEIGLSRFAPEVLRQGLTLRFLPLRRDAPIYLPPEQRPDFGEQDALVEVKAIALKIVREEVFRIC